MDMQTHIELQSVGADTTVSDQPPILPSWLSNPDPAPLTTSKERKALLFVQFETAFPRVLEMMSSGYTFTSAVRELPLELDHGAFLRWIKKEPGRAEMYKEAKEIRTEAWAGKLIEYAEGVDSAEDVQRSKLKVDTLKWLMAADNRKTYGDTKSIELGGTISITAALAAANSRLIEGEVLEAVEPRQLENDDE